MSYWNDINNNECNHSHSCYDGKCVSEKELVNAKDDIIATTKEYADNYTVEQAKEHAEGLQSAFEEEFSERADTFENGIDTRVTAVENGQVTYKSEVNTTITNFKNDVDNDINIFETVVNSRISGIENTENAHVTSVTATLNGFETRINNNESVADNAEVIATEALNVANSNNARFDTVVNAVTTDTEVTDIRVGVDSVTYSTAGESVRANDKSLYDITNTLVEDSYTLTDLTVNGTSTGWNLTGTGLCASDSTAKLVKYSCTPGDVLYMRISKEHGGVYQFQSNTSVPASGTNPTVIGSPISTAINGFVTVPTGAWHLIISTGKDNTFPIVKKAVKKTADVSTTIKTLVTNNTSHSEYCDIDIKQFCIDTCANLATNGDNLLFFTDSHIANQSGQPLFAAGTAEKLNTIEKVYNNLPLDLCVFGGDVLGNGDTKDIARWKLAYWDGAINRKIDHYLPVLGNHDTNYQGIERFTNDEQIKTAKMWRDKNSCYYRYDTPNTSYYVFDTGIEATGYQDYYVNQCKWFAEDLKTNNKNIVLIFHQIYKTYASQIVASVTDLVLATANAYNSRGSVGIGSEEYFYTNATGTVKCGIGGHTHADYTTTIYNIPIIVTDMVQANGGNTFDIMSIDYDTDVLTATRYNNGTTRTLPMVTIE